VLATERRFKGVFQRLVPLEPVCLAKWWIARPTGKKKRSIGAMFGGREEGWTHPTPKRQSSKTRKVG